MVSGRGIGLMINLLYGGTNPSFTSPLLQGLSVGHIGLIPTRLILGAAIFGALWLLIRRTALGLFLESVGGNSAAADLAGINARLIKYAAYIICGLCAAWAGRDPGGRHPYVRSGQHRPLHRARRHSRRRHRRRFAVGRAHLSRHDDSGRAGHSDADHLDSHQRPAAGIQSGRQGVRRHRRPACCSRTTFARRCRKASAGGSDEREIPAARSPRSPSSLALFVTGGLLYNNFLSTLVLGDILADNAFVIIAAIGTTFVIL